MEQEIRDWILRISTKRPELNGFAVCPFAENASYTIERRSIGNITPIFGVDVAIFIVESHLSSEVLREWRQKYNDLYPEYEFLEDGMDEPTFIEKIQSNFGKENLMLVQNKNHLEEMRKILQKTSYYSYWDKNVMDKIQNKYE